MTALAPQGEGPAPVAWRYPVLSARGEAVERMAKAMRTGKAWPVVFSPKVAEQLAEDALYALEAAAPAPDLAGLREALDAAIRSVMYGHDGRLLTGDFYPGHDAIVDAALSALIPKGG